MAGIQCTTPKIKNLFSSVIPRVQKIPASIEVGKFGRIDVLPFQKVNPGIASVKIENLQDLNPLTNDIEVNTVECSWFYGKWQHGDKMPGWNGYCELLTRNYKPFELAQIMYLPIIDAPPSDYDTIYTSLKVAVEKSAAAG
ncbi:uncharacterized protein [Mycetomoellerius zeteki]|uniref:uncharacterized protein n=1 Tax=Mycetomoellerius zeteki TaxID=64791 RepID=UPI00084E84D7|nr:PREDICTED: uncharacterized protein LOC108731903 [Trachymyrmex zeteki]